MTTAYNLDWFRENFENIRVDVDRMKYLDELQITVSTLNSKDLALIASQLQLDVIFDCINTSDKYVLIFILFFIRINTEQVNQYKINT